MGITSTTKYPSMLTVNHHFLILQKFQGRLREKEHCQNPMNFRFSQTEIKLKISHHLQVNTPHSVMTSKVWWQSSILQFTFWHRDWCSNVRECITIDTSLHVSLSYDGHVIPLLEWFHNVQKLHRYKAQACLKILHRI